VFSCAKFEIIITTTDVGIMCPFNNLHSRWADQDQGLATATLNHTSVVFVFWLHVNWQTPPESNQEL